MRSGADEPLPASGTPSTSTSSSMMAGMTELVGSSAGFATTTPFMLENQSRPDFIFKPAGKNPVAHSSEANPSDSPKRYGNTGRSGDVAWKSCLLTQVMP